MPDFLDAASGWLDSVLQEHVSQAVEIRRGAASSGPVQATIGSTEFQESNDEGIVSTFQTRDYLIAVADYQLSGVVVKPEAGQLILEAGLTYEVVSPGDEPAYRYSDASRRMWRVHTKLISQ